MNFLDCFRYTILTSSLIFSATFLTLSILAFIHLELPPMYKDLIISTGAAQFAFVCSCNFFMLRCKNKQSLIKRTLSQERARIADEFVDAEAINSWRKISAEGVKNAA